MPTAKLTSKGQATIPKEVRDHLDLQPGDRIEFAIEPDGRVVVLPATLDVADLRGILPAPERPISLDEMEAVIRKQAGKR